MVLLHLDMEVGKRVNALVAERILARVGVPATNQITDWAFGDVAEAVVKGEAVDAVVEIGGPGHVAGAEDGKWVVDGVGGGRTLSEIFEIDGKRCLIAGAQHPAFDGSETDRADSTHEGVGRGVRAQYEPAVGCGRELGNGSFSV